MDSVSMWEATAGKRKQRPVLQGDHHCDVVIIGGGYTGLSTAYHLQGKGHDTIVLEKYHVGYGASGRNGGELLTGFQGTMESWAAKKGMETAKQMWQLSLDSIDVVENLIKEHDLSCDFVRNGDIRPAYKPSHLDKFKREQEYMAKTFDFHELAVLEKNEIKKDLNTDFYYGARTNERGAHFHPLKFARELANLAEEQGAAIYEHSEVLEVKRKGKVVVTTAQGRVIADEIVVGTNAYPGNFNKTIKGSIVPVESIMIATEPVPAELLEELMPTNRAASDSKNLLYYFRRTADNRMAFGGSGRALNKRDQLRLFDTLQEGMHKVFPKLQGFKVEYQWGGKVGFTQEMQPYIGQLEDGTHFAHGYCGRGASMAVMAGKVLAETIVDPADVVNPLKKEKLRPIPFHSQHAKAVGLMKFYKAFQDRFTG